MFLTLLFVTFVVALTVASIVARLFTGPVDRILKRITSEEISGGWLRYMQFAIVVVGVSRGVRIYNLERYINPQVRDNSEGRILALTQERWILELYRTVIETLEGIAWMLLWFFAIALIAYVVVRAFELKRAKSTSNHEGGT